MKKSTMKKYVNISDNSIVYIGRTSDVKAMYKSIARASRKYHTDLITLFSAMPKFSENKMAYGIVIEDLFFHVISSDVFTAMLLAGELEVEED